MEEKKDLSLSSSFSLRGETPGVKASFLYRDEFGELLYRADYDADLQVRYHVKAGETWVEGLPDLMVPYNLPGLYSPRDGMVLIAGDEFDVEALRSLGLVATCGMNHLAGGVFPAEWARHFAGRSVVIIDSPFEWHRDIASLACLVLKGVARELAVVIPEDAQIIDTPFGPAKERIHHWMRRKAFTRASFGDWLYAECAKWHDSVDLDQKAQEADYRDHHGDAYEGDKEPFAKYEADWKPFPVDALPHIVAQYVGEMAHALMVDPAAVALPALVAIAGCIGNSRVLKLKSTWTEPAIIFGCLIGEPSSRKSAAMKAAMGPVKKWNGEMLSRWNDEMTEFEAEIARWHAAQNKKEAAENGFALIAPKAPVRRRILVSNITVETFIPRLAENPRGLLICRDELRGWFASFGQYAKSGAGADECFWLEVFLGDEYHYDRKTGEHTSIRIANLVGSVIGTIQPGMWRRISVQDMFDSGMMGRILTAYPPKLLSTFDSFEPSAEAVSLYDHLLNALISLDYDRSNERDWKPVQMVFTDGARRLWTSWDNQARKEQHNADGEIAAMLGKMEAYCARFALIFAVCDLVLDGGGSEVVEERHVASAIRLYDWFREEAERNYALADMTSVESDDARILQKIRSHADGITAWELWKSNRRRWRDTDKARARLDAMAGFVRQDDGRETNTGNGVLIRKKSAKGFRYYVKGAEPK